VSALLYVLGLRTSFLEYYTTAVAKFVGHISTLRGTAGWVDLASLGNIAYVPVYSTIMREKTEI
jgi:hypothetical protein